MGTATETKGKGKGKTKDKNQEEIHEETAETGGEETAMIDELVDKILDELDSWDDDDDPDNNIRSLREFVHDACNPNCPDGPIWAAYARGLIDGQKKEMGGNPFRAHTDLGKTLYEAWNTGWEASAQEKPWYLLGEAFLPRVTNVAGIQGQTAHMYGYAITDCPYTEDAEMAGNAWREGWNSITITETKTVMVTRRLSVPLTDEQLMEAGAELAEAIVNLRDLQRKLKNAQAGFKELMEPEQGKIQEISNRLHAGCDWEDVECEKTIDYEAGRVTIVRIDTGELVEDREIAESERQKEMF